MLLFYVAAPIPTVISKRQNSDNSSCLEFAIFITVGIILSSFGLPIVLAHAEAIKWGACILTLCGNVVVYATILGYFLAVQVSFRIKYYSLDSPLHIKRSEKEVKIKEFIVSLLI